MLIVLLIYNSVCKFQSSHTLKITLCQPKIESQAGNSPHFNSQFDPPHLQTQTFHVSTVIQYNFPKTTLRIRKTQKQHSEDKKKKKKKKKKKTPHI